MPVGWFAFTGASLGITETCYRHYFTVCMSQYWTKTIFRLMLPIRQNNLFAIEEEKVIYIIISDRFFMGAKIALAA